MKPEQWRGLLRLGFEGAIDYSYDRAGQVLREGNAIAGSNGQTAGSAAVRKELIYTRYPSGEVSSLTYPSGFTVERAYTARGQLENVIWNGGIVRYFYLADGKVDYQDCGNGIRTDLDYDGRGFTKLTNSFKLSTQQAGSKRTYWRDSRDRITAWKKNETGRGDRYSYDAEGQLTNASYQALTPETNPTSPLRGDIFAYDALGNRVRSNYVASRGWMDFTRKDNGLNQYRAWWNYSIINYDDDIGGTWGAPAAANGVIMQDGWITGGFNALNQPMMIWSRAYNGTANWMWFGYDPLGRCVKRWVGSSSTTSTNPATYLYYDGWNLVQEGSSATNVGRLYVHGNRVDEIVASLTAGSWNYHHYDARGHCILLTGPSGNVIEQYEYDAFGQPYFYNGGGALLPNGSSFGNRFLFTGREWLRDLKLYDYRNRMYQPELGRFLQPDPKQFAAGDYNLYRYCHNDPVNHTDPTGLYGMGTGWTDEQWKKFDTAQQAAASRLEKASVKIDAKVFEKVFGKGSATAENMAKVQHTTQGMAAALRDDGTKGYVANARPEPGSSVMGRGSEPGKTVWINTAHGSFGKIGPQSWNVGHESGHNMGLHHGTGDNAAYKYGNDAQKAAYENLSPADRLRNPDNYMDFAR